MYLKFVEFNSIWVLMSWLRRLIQEGIVASLGNFQSRPRSSGAAQISSRVKDGHIDESIVLSTKTLWKKTRKKSVQEKLGQLHVVVENWAQPTFMISHVQLHGKPSLHASTCGHVSLLPCRVFHLCLVSEHILCLDFCCWNYCSILQVQNWLRNYYSGNFSVCLLLGPSYSFCSILELGPEPLILHTICSMLEPALGIMLFAGRQASRSATKCQMQSQESIEKPKRMHKLSTKKHILFRKDEMVRKNAKIRSR